MWLRASERKVKLSFAGFFLYKILRGGENNMEKEILTLKDVSIILDLSMPSIYKLIRNDNSFPVIRLGEKYGVSKAKLNEWIDNKTKYKN